MAAKDYRKNDFVFKAVTAFRIAVGVALTLAVLFAMVWLIDYSSEPSSSPHTQTLLLPDNGEENKPRKSDTFIEAFLKKKEEKEGDGAGYERHTPYSNQESQGSPGNSAFNKPDSQPVISSPEAPGVSVPPQDSRSKKKAAGASPRADFFTVQLGSFQETERARAFSENLAAKGYQPYISNTVMPNGKKAYRVRIGRYATREEAMELASSIEAKEKISVFVTTR